MEDVTRVELAIVVAGFKLSAQLALSVVKQRPGVVAAVQAPGVNAADRSAVVGTAVDPRAERRQVFRVVHATKDDGTIRIGVDEVDR